MNAHPALFFAAFTAPTVIDDGAVHQKPLGVSFRDSVMPNRNAPPAGPGAAGPEPPHGQNGTLLTRKPGGHQGSTPTRTKLIVYSNDEFIDVDEDNIIGWVWIDDENHIESRCHWGFASHQPTKGEAVRFEFLEPVWIPRQRLHQRAQHFIDRPGAPEPLDLFVKLGSCNDVAH